MRALGTGRVHIVNVVELHSARGHVRAPPRAVCAFVHVCLGKCVPPRGAERESCRIGPAGILHFGAHAAQALHRILARARRIRHSQLRTAKRYVWYCCKILVRVLACLWRARTEACGSRPLRAQRCIRAATNSSCTPAKKKNMQPAELLGTLSHETTSIQCARRWLALSFVAATSTAHSAV